MSGPISLNRRDFLRLSSLSVATLVTAPLLSGCEAIERLAADAAADTVDLEIALQATQREVAIFPGSPTRVWTYQGQVIHGDSASLQTLPGSYLGPIIRARTGQRVRIVFTNELPEATIVHWHGLHVPEAADGHPRLAIKPGQTYVYEFQVLDRAGTYWFHPHPHGRTGPQVYNGLAGLFIISDDEESAASLPSGEFDVPLVIQDRTFDANNQLLYLPGGMMDQMMGFLGEHILVNGQPDFVLPVSARPYRLRLLNGSNARIYKLGWDDDTPLTVLGTDGGLLEKPVQRSYITLAPAERIELWVDFSGRPVGSELRLKSLAFAGAEGGGMGMMMGRPTALPEGSEFDLLRVYVEHDSEEMLALPERLSIIQRYRPEDAVNAGNPRTFTIAMQRMRWLLNGRTFEMRNVTEDEKVKLYDLEVWEFINQPGRMRRGMMGGMMEEMAHPMHVHGLQFQVIERQVRPEMRANWETVSDGFVDEGWKDTVLVMPGERVKVLLKFKDFAGLYLYHCHNLEHEDLGLMRNYRVVA